MVKGKVNSFNLWRDIVLWLYLGVEVFLIFFVVMYWKDLQEQNPLFVNSWLCQLSAGSGITLGFLRSIIILVIPAVLLLPIVFVVNVLYSKITKIGGIELKNVYDDLKESEQVQQKLVDELKEEQDKNRQSEIKIKALTQMLYPSFKKKDK